MGERERERETCVSPWGHPFFHSSFVLTEHCRPSRRTQNHDSLFWDPQILRKVILKYVLVELGFLQVLLEVKLHFHDHLHWIQNAGAVVLVCLGIEVDRPRICAA